MSKRIQESIERVAAKMVASGEVKSAKVLVPIGVQVGDKIRRIGGRIASADGLRTLDDGDVGDVMEIHSPRAGHGVIVDLDGEEVPDPDRHGYAVVAFPKWLPSRIVIRVEDEGQRWTKA